MPSADLRNTTFQRRVLTGILSVMALIAGSFVPTYFEVGSTLLGVMAGIGSVSCVVLVVAANRGASVRWVGHAGVAMIATLLTLDNTQTGGFFDPNLSWLYVVPVLAGLLVSAAAAVAWTGVVITVVVVFWYAEALGLPIHNVIPPEDHAVQSLVNRVATLVALGGMSVVFVVERNRSHRELAAAVAVAEAASSTSNQFLATMSHELRTPLNAILGYCELAVEQVESDDLVALPNDLERIRRSGLHLLGLVDDVLTLSKLDAHALEMQLEEVDVPSALAQAVDAVRPMVDRNGNTVTLSAAPAAVRADAFRLQQVLLNLLSNAAKFTENGTIDVRAVVEGDAVVICVQDDGIGIPEAKLGAVFERFRQVDGSVTRLFGGTGLGLAICRELVASMQGRIGVESVEGEGSTFVVRLPRWTAGPEADDRG